MENLRNLKGYIFRLIKIYLKYLIDEWGIQVKNEINNLKNEKI